MAAYLQFVDGWAVLVDTSEPAEGAIPVTPAQEAEIAAAMADPDRQVHQDGPGWRIDPYTPTPTGAMVDREAARRVATGLVFGGRTFQFGADSRENIMGAASLAGQAIAIDNKLPGDVFWHGGTDPFVFIDAANQNVLMDAQTARGFGQAGASWQSKHIFAARALKDGAYTEDGSIPPEFADDAYWPDPAAEDPLAPVVLPVA